MSSLQSRLLRIYKERAAKESPAIVVGGATMAPVTIVEAKPRKRKRMQSAGAGVVGGAAKQQDDERELGQKLLELAIGAGLVGGAASKTKKRKRVAAIDASQHTKISVTPDVGQHKSKRQEAAKHNKWIIHVKKYQQMHPGVTWAQALKDAQSSYTR
jgi:hypothetical protein